MQNTVHIYFPDTTKLAEFVLQNSISNVEINSRDCSLEGTVGEDEIMIAETRFEAVIEKKITKH